MHQNLSLVTYHGREPGQPQQGWSEVWCFSVTEMTETEMTDFETETTETVTAVTTETVTEVTETVTGEW